MTERTWAATEARAKFCEVARRACVDGPQHITRSGKSAVVVVSAEDWERVSGPSKRGPEGLTR